MNEGDALGPDGDSRPGSWTENPIRKLYSVYGPGNRRFALLGALVTVVGRAFGLVPAFVIWLAVDAIFLAERPYALPLVPPAWIPSTGTEQLYLSIGVLIVATVGGAVTSWIEDWGWSVFAQRIRRDLRVDACDRLQGLEPAYFPRRWTGDLMSVLNNVRESSALAS
jgi:ATP-binding cassette subfamily B protein